MRVRLPVIPGHHGGRMPRRGFTLLELLVVIAVLAVLTGLLMPAVQKVREAAARAGCRNNLKQLGLGLHDYHAAAGYYPPGALRAPDTGPVGGVYRKFGVTRNGVRHSWAVFVLPHLEQENLARQYNLNEDWAAAANDAVRQTPLKIMSCPSSPGGPRVYTRSDAIPAGAGGGTRTFWAASADYAPNNAYHPALEPALADPVADRGGVLQVNESRRVEEITDGTSNTILLSECAGRPDRWQAGALRAPDGQINGAGWADDVNEFIVHGFTADGSATPGPCHTNCTNQNEVYAFHPGGANHVLADGSVRFVAANADIRQFVKLTTRAGNEIIAGIE